MLIHSGSGGVGQAAISICLKMGCEVFTTVGTKEKREYLMATFPDLKPENIGNSRDLSFEQMVRCARFDLTVINLDQIKMIMKYN